MSAAPLILPLPWGAPGLSGFTSTRQGGVSRGAYDSLNLGLNTDDDPAAVVANRTAALGAGGWSLERTVFLQQVHGAVILEAKGADHGKGSRTWDQGLPGCDAVFTREAGLALAIGHADCLAVAVADPEAGLVGLAHAGWRGALAGLPGLLARRLIAEGARPERLQAVLSPCLGPRNLELGEEQHRLFQAAWPQAAAFTTGLVHGHFHLDLWTCARLQLEQSGVPASRIQGQELDTAELPSLFYSHRRDLGQTGRMLTVVGLVVS